jgi:putative photosynthetic complex assembly protein
MTGRISPLTGLPAGIVPPLGPTPPRAPFAVIAVVTAIVMVGVALPSGHGAMFPVKIAPVPLQVARQIQFVELPQEKLAVLDASNQKQIALLQAEQNGFLHAVVHGLMVTRHRAGIAKNIPFGLSLYADGRLVLTDPPTRTSIDVEGFGPTNMAGILAFLSPEGHRA